MKDQQYIVMPAKELPVSTIIRYWSDLHANLPYFLDRWNDYIDPTIGDAFEHTFDNATLTFFAFRPKQDLTPLGEFTLEPLGRGIFLTHYSSNPTVQLPLADKFEISIYFHRLVFDTQASALFGLTPRQNKKAIATALRFGYKKIDTIKNAASHRGEPTDATLTIFTRERFYTIYGDRP